MAASTGRVTVEVKASRARAEVELLRSKRLIEELADDPLFPGIKFPKSEEPMPPVVILKGHTPVPPIVGSPTTVEEINTKYLRENYAEDQVIQAYADVIEQHVGIWEGIKNIVASGIDLSGYHLRGWRVNTEHEVRTPLTSMVEFDLIKKEIL